MSWKLGLCVAGCGLFLVGCDASPPPLRLNPPPTVVTVPPPTTTTDAAKPASTEGAPEPTAPTSGTEPAPATAGAIALTPENTQIEFIGLHVGEKPDPRKGGFDKFTGKLEVDAAAKTVKSVSIDIDVASLRTEFPKLTDHLKSADFFEAREFPAIKFESTEIKTGSAGEQSIKGNLTLHGVTKEITLLATVDFSGESPKLQSNFKIDRTEFGMSFGVDKVEKEVSLTVTVGGKP